ncbi:MAG: hypothetical protein H7Z16_14155 [Pyrinomonadaceae bacterium]|nr:hypothetical protein [Pyrinomonadaceae bacterium]
MKKYLTYLLASTLVLATISLPVTAKQGDTQATTVERIKIKIAKLGVGAKAKATVFLKDGTKKKGYIAQAGDDDFVIRDRQTDAATTIRYTDVAKVDNNKGHSTARNITIGVAVGVGAVLAVLGLLIAGLDD